MFLARQTTATDWLATLTPRGNRIRGAAHTNPTVDEVDRLELLGHNGQLTLTYTTHDGEPVDLSHDPSRAVHQLTRGKAGPTTRRNIERHLAEGIENPPADLNGAQTLLWGMFPFVQTLHHQGLLDAVPIELPATLAPLHRLDGLDAVYIAVFGAPPNRRARRAFAAAIFTGGRVHHHRLSTCPAACDLAADQIADILEIMVDTPSDPDNIVGLDLAVAAGRALGTRKDGRHDPRLQSDRMKLLAARPETSAQSPASYLGTVGAAALTNRFDPGGLQASSLDHLHARAREAVNGINRLQGSLTWLAGKPVPGAGPDLRYRIVRRTEAAELAYAGKEMENCLGQWAPGGPYAHMLRPGDHIVLIVEPGGRHIAAGHVRRQQQLLSLLGPDNQPVPEPARARIVRGLRDAGVTATTNLNDNEPPF